MPQKGTPPYDAHPHRQLLILLILMHRLDPEVKYSPHEILLLFCLIFFVLQTLILFAEIPEIVEAYQFLASLRNFRDVHVSLAEEILVLPINTREPCIEMLRHPRVCDHPYVLWQTVVKHLAVALSLFQLAHIQGKHIPKCTHPLIGAAASVEMGLIDIFIGWHQASPFKG